MIVLVASMQNPGGLAEQLQRLKEGLHFMLPEIGIVITIILLVVYDLLFQKNKSVGLAAILFSAFSFLLVFQVLSFLPEANALPLFEGLVTHSAGANLFKIGFLLSLLVALLMAVTSRKDSLHYFDSSEVLVCLLGVLLGAFLLVMSSNLLMIYVAVELVSICSYLLTGLGKGKKKSEAAIKYLLYGAAASAVMLYGMSWLYGLTGSIDLNSDSFKIGLDYAAVVPLNIAVFMVLCGLLFKLGAFPLHVWAPDVYRATPLPTVAVFSVVPKLAALLVLLRLVAATSATHFDWQTWLGILSIGGMVVGNFSALWQDNAKRMLAYSSIAHAAFLLAGVSIMNRTGLEATVFYALAYLLMNLAAFYLIQMVENKVGSTSYEQLKGMGKKIPYVSVLLLIVMVALTGLPPTVGFNAKLYLFSAVYDEFGRSESTILLWVLLVGLLNTVVSLFDYIKIPYLLFFKEGEGNVAPGAYTIRALIPGTLLVLSVLLLFFRSDWFVDLLNSINFVL